MLCSPTRTTYHFLLPVHSIFWYVRVHALFLHLAGNSTQQPGKQGADQQRKSVQKNFSLNFIFLNYFIPKVNALEAYRGPEPLRTPEVCLGVLLQKASELFKTEKESKVPTKT